MADFIANVHRMFERFPLAMAVLMAYFAFLALVGFTMWWSDRRRARRRSLTTEEGHESL